MDILKFALGIRFDSLKDSVGEDFKELVLSELTSSLSAKDVEGLHILGGVNKIDPRDSEGVYTVVFMNGKLGKMRRLYSKIDGDGKLHSLLEARDPYVQNNVIRAFTDMEYFGAVSKNGRTEGGSRELVFLEKPVERIAYYENTIILAPNSFKGTVPAKEAVRRLSAALRKKLPETALVPVPAADGGDGTLEAIESGIITQRRTVAVTAPYGDSIKADYLVADGTKAIIESALASGLALCADYELDPLKASSFGTGELILRAVNEGLKDIYVCLGGSATNDCGIGMARALGVRFLDAGGNEISEAGEMDRIAFIDAENVGKLVREARFTAVCDVSNPLTGVNGATYTFGPQKGAAAETLLKLENGMLNIEKLLNDHAGRNVCSEPGAGAAGGMGAMLMAVFGARYMCGSEAILDVADFDRKLRHAVLVVTGEGRIDSTSMQGKAVGEIIKHAEKAGVPVALIAGCRGEGAEEPEKHAVFTEYADEGEDVLSRFDRAAEKLADDIYIWI